jgi:hypothetical protein
MTYQIAVISHARAKAVTKIQQYAPEAIWYVGYGEKTDYEAAGAHKVIESGNLIDSRNAALNDAHALGLASVQISDDLNGLEILQDDQLHPITLTETITILSNVADSWGVKLAGVAPVANKFYLSETNPIKQHHFIIGDLIFVKPSEPRFDPNLRLKEDYDFTAQHITTYGAVARLDTICAKFAHRTNAGGAVEYRNTELEQQAITYLKSKWGNTVIVDNPRRPNEILFKGKQLLRDFHK